MAAVESFEEAPETIPIGVDACSGGWLATGIIDGRSIASLYSDFKKLWLKHSDADRILVDIPIGLSEQGRRECDEEAKDLLGCRGISVFYTPCQQAVRAEEYEEANKAHRKEIGEGLMKQAYNISPKIKQVAEIISEYDTAEDVILESHPEVCFYALNRQPIAYPKSSERGRKLRLHLLNQVLSDPNQEYQKIMSATLRKDVARDDILDALVLSGAAATDDLIFVPEAPSSKQPRIYYPDPGHIPYE